MPALILPYPLPYETSRESLYRELGYDAKTFRPVKRRRKRSYIKRIRRAVKVAYRIITE